MGLSRLIFGFIHLLSFLQRQLQQMVDDHWAFPYHVDEAYLPGLTQQREGVSHLFLSFNKRQEN